MDNIYDMDKPEELGADSWQAMMDAMNFYTANVTNNQNMINVANTSMVNHGTGPLSANQSNRMDNANMVNNANGYYAVQSNSSLNNHGFYRNPGMAQPQPTNNFPTGGGPMNLDGGAMQANYGTGLPQQMSMSMMAQNQPIQGMSMQMPIQMPMQPPMPMAMSMTMQTPATAESSRLALLRDTMSLETKLTVAYNLRRCRDSGLFTHTELVLVESYLPKLYSSRYPFESQLMMDVLCTVERGWVNVPALLALTMASTGGQIEPHMSPARDKKLIKRLVSCLSKICKHGAGRAAVVRGTALSRVPGHCSIHVRDVPNNQGGSPTKLPPFHLTAGGLVCKHTHWLCQHGMSPHPEAKEVITASELRQAPAPVSMLSNRAVQNNNLGVFGPVASQWAPQPPQQQQQQPLVQQQQPPQFPPQQGAAVVDLTNETDQGQVETAGTVQENNSGETVSEEETVNVNPEVYHGHPPVGQVYTPAPTPAMAPAPAETTAQESVPAPNTQAAGPSVPEFRTDAVDTTTASSEEYHEGSSTNNATGIAGPTFDNNYQYEYHTEPTVTPVEPTVTPAEAATNSAPLTINPAVLQAASPYDNQHFAVELIALQEAVDLEEEQCRLEAGSEHAGGPEAAPSLGEPAAQVATEVPQLEPQSNLSIFTPGSDLSSTLSTFNPEWDNGSEDLFVCQ